jgi:cytochrome c oxidase assembly protein subunit 15
MRGRTVFRYAAIASVLVCYATILIGGNVMASDSGLACPDWPTCHGTFLPPLSGGSGIEWAHRLSAVVLSASIAFMTVAAFLFERSRPVVLRLSLAASSLVLAQALLGGVVVETDLAVWLVLLHLALATALFALLLALALLANFRDIPRRWIDYAWRATEETPPSLRPGADAGAPSTPSRRPSDAIAPTSD